jgi:DNA-binding beta-propeller fold protein YncE
MSTRRLAPLVLLSVLVSITCAQEQKRQERMEAADPQQPDNPSSAVLPDEHPRLPGLMPDGEIVLHNQWSLRPAGRHTEVGDFPVNIAIHPSGKFAAVLHCGQSTHEVVIVKLSSRSVIARVIVPQAFYGLCFQPDGQRLFASGGEYDVVHVWNVDAEGLLSNHKQLEVVPRKESFVVAGLSTSSDGQRLFACGAWGERLAIISLADKLAQSAKQFVSFEKDTYPYLAIPSHSGEQLYVSLWGGSAVAVVNLADLKISAIWPTPSHPAEMLLSPDGNLLYVACANSNLVAVIDVRTGKTLEVLNSALFPTAPSGSTPSSLALSPDGQILLVANATNNNLAVLNVAERGEARSLGFIPTGWYPTSVRFTPSGKILVANGKGLTPRTNRHGPAPGIAAKNLREYIGGLHQGAVSWIAMPKADQLTQLTAEAYLCSPLRSDNGARNSQREPNNPIPAKLGDPSPIKHCIYIIKENRTYDQVFGDMPEGNGDPSICLFPEQVTPNQHALAREFVLLDNFYVESEVSADGHEWTMGAYATDFVERSWPLSYRKQPKESEIKYPSEGGYDIAIPAGGYLWDRCKEAGVSYFSFGEWIANGAKPGDPGRAKTPTLKGHFDPFFRGYDLEVSDITRAERFISELKRFESEGALPQFVVVRLPNDHTYGTRVGKLTPTAMVAENDLAVGMVIEAISKSRYWPKTAVFIVEDDAQNGSDHVDAHRTVALVISPWTKRHYVDSSLYSTSSMLRTMELILGLQPMSQFDAAALPMYASFQSTPDLTPYETLPAQVDIKARNLKTAWGADVSEQLDLSVEDAADDLVLNEIVWKSVKGADSEMPPPVRAAFVFNWEEDED